MSELKKIGKRIKEARTSKGLSQEEVAFRAEMDRAYLSEIESGLKNLSVSVLLKICKAIDIQPEDIVKGL